MPNHRWAAARMCLALALGVVALGASSRSANAQEKKQGRQASRIEIEGWRQYMVHCARCHGDDAVGGVMAPDLRGSVAKGRVDQASFHAVVADGRRDKGMPGFKGTLADDQIKKIFAYVKARGKGEIPTGRPG
jgi:mono/diheme cytochrome c family protein